MSKSKKRKSSRSRSLDRHRKSRRTDEQLRDLQSQIHNLTNAFQRWSEDAKKASSPEVSELARASYETEGKRKRGKLFNSSTRTLNRQSPHDSDIEQLEKFYLQAYTISVAQGYIYNSTVPHERELSKSIRLDVIECLVKKSNKEKILQAYTTSVTQRYTQISLSLSLSLSRIHASDRTHEIYIYICIYIILSPFQTQ